VGKPTLLVQQSLFRWQYVSDSFAARFEIMSRLAVNHSYVGTEISWGNAAGGYRKLIINY